MIKGTIVKKGILLVISFTIVYILLHTFSPELLIFTSVKKQVETKIDKLGTPLNPYILQVIESYSDKNFPRMCEPKEVNRKLGISKDIYYQGEKILSAGSDPCLYCIGFIFEVYINAWEIVHKEKNANTIGSLTPKSIKAFRKVFYGTNGNQKTCVDALTKYGLGVEINDISLAQPGDLVQFWRYNKTGHCVVLIRLEKDYRGNITGIHYWSVQRTTDGIAYKSEFFGKQSNSIDINKIYIVRPIIPYVSQY